MLLAILSVFAAVLAFIEGREITVDWTAGFSNSSARYLEALVDPTVPSGCSITLSFEWERSHNVYSLPDNKAFEDCDFSGAQLLGEKSPTKKNLLTSCQLGQPIVHYFACKVPGHCVAGQKLSLLIDHPGSRSRLKGCGPDCNVRINKYCCKKTVEDKDVCCDIARVPSDRIGCNVPGKGDERCKELGHSDTCFVDTSGSGVCRCGSGYWCYQSAKPICKNGECVPETK